MKRFGRHDFEDDLINQTLPDQQISDLDQLHDKIRDVKNELDEDTIEILEKMMELYIRTHETRQKAEALHQLTREA